MVKIIYSKTDGEVRQAFWNPEQPHFSKDDEEVILLDPPPDFELAPQFFKVKNGKLVADQDQLDTRKVILQQRKNEDKAAESLYGMTFSEFKDLSDNEKWKLLFSVLRSYRRKIRL